MNKSLSFLLPYFQLIRLPNGFTAVSNIIAAAVIASFLSGTSVAAFTLVLLILSSLCLYFGGMALNDCFDKGEDLRERPTRPLPSGQISILFAWLFASGLMLLGVFLASQVSSQSMLIASILVFAIFLYNGLTKRFFYGAFVMGSCRYLNWLLGMSIVSLSPSQYLCALPIFVYISALTFLSKEEVGAENRRPLLICFGMLLLVALIVAGLIGAQVLPFKLTYAALAIAFALISYRLFQTYANFTPQRIQQAVMTLVLGVIPLDALMVLAAGYPVVALFILSLIIPSRKLAAFLYVT